MNIFEKLYCCPCWSLWVHLIFFLTAGGQADAGGAKEPQTGAEKNKDEED